MERLKTMEEQLISIVQTQMGNLEKVNTKELGEVIDMIKDLEMAMYYCTIIHAMTKEEDKETRSNSYYYTERYIPYPEEYDYYRYPPMMYYGENTSNNKSSSNNNQSSSKDSREGRSGMYRKMYMESKHTQQDSAKKMQDLESYMHELSSDMLEMIQDASPEEKAILSKKLNTLASKVQNV